MKNRILSVLLTLLFIVSAVNLPASAVIELPEDPVSEPTQRIELPDDELDDDETDTYTVVFLNCDGTVLSENTYHYGDTVTVPDDPTKPADDTYTYSFTGWDKPVTAVTGNATYTATYTEAYIEYTVKFLNYDGGVLSEKTYHYGDTVTVPDDPTKPADDTYTYSFTGWDKPVTAVTGDATYTATYTETYIEYTVKFLNYDGGVLSEKTYHYGDTVTVPDDPTKPADDTYTYSFTGWDKPVTAVTGDATYTATYTETYIEYTVKFLNYDGAVLSENAYHYGDTVTVPDDPSKPADDTYTYSFTGWDKPVTAVTGDATYTATYTETYIEYTVKFVDYDGRIISETNYRYNDPVTAPENPSRESDGLNTYTFSGWDKDITVCRGDETYTATYTTDVNVYTVAFRNHDKTLISVKTYHYGDTVTAPAAPVKASDGEYYYVFSGWNKEILPVSENAEYTAVFEARPHEWSEPVYEWSADRSSVTASRASLNDGAVKQTETAGVSVTVMSADCELDGMKTYTAVFTNPAFERQTYEETVYAAGHRMKFTGFTWDGEEAYADYECETCGKPVSVKAEIFVRTSEPSCEQNGETVYAAGVKAEDSPDGAPHTDEKRVVINAKGHEWSFTGFTWTQTETGYEAEAGYVCGVCGNTAAVKAAVAVTETDPECEKDGETVYSAEIAVKDGYDGLKHTESKSVIIPQTGHTRVFAGFEWNGLDAAKAKFVCSVCEDVKEIAADVAMTEKDGVITYTASASFDGTEYTDKKYEYINYTVKFVDHDGTIISEKTYHYGDTVTVPDDPAKPADNTYTYTFAGWDKPVTPVTGDATYTAAYTETYIAYTVKFLNYDGTVLSEKTYHYGDAVTVPEDPERADDGDYVYTFNGWDKAVTAVTADAVYTAAYDAKEKEPPFVYGDINGDGEADNRDVAALFRYLSGKGGALNEDALDVNGDGKINNKDVTVLFRYLNGRP